MLETATLYVKLSNGVKKFHAKQTVLYIMLQQILVSLV